MEAASESHYARPTENAEREADELGVVPRVAEMEGMNLRKLKIFRPVPSFC